MHQIENDLIPDFRRYCRQAVQRSLRRATAGPVESLSGYSDSEVIESYRSAIAGEDCARYLMRDLVITRRDIRLAILNFHRLRLCSDSVGGRLRIRIRIPRNESLLPNRDLVDDACLIEVEDDVVSIPEIVHSDGDTGRSARLDASRDENEFASIVHARREAKRPEQNALPEFSDLERRSEAELEIEVDADRGLHCGEHRCVVRDSGLETCLFEEIHGMPAHVQRVRLADLECREV